MFADLLQAAMSEVNLHEIAQHYIELAQEVSDSEEAEQE